VRLWYALALLALTQLIWKGRLVPTEASGDDWLWLALSAVVGLVIGDLLYFGALKRIGPRLALLLFTLAPPVSALGEWIVYGKGLSPLALGGMAATLAGLVIVIGDRKVKANGIFRVTAVGILLGVGGSVCQGAGLVLSKMGLDTVDPVTGTYIRMITAAPTYAVIYFLTGGRLRPILRQGKGMAFAFGGAFFGPFLGVTASLFAAKYTHSGIAMTILSTTPITVLPYAILIYKERLTLRTLLGTVVAVAGVSLFFL